MRRGADAVRAPLAGMPRREWKLHIHTLQCKSLQSCMHGRNMDIIVWGNKHLMHRYIYTLRSPSHQQSNSNIILQVDTEPSLFCPFVFSCSSGNRNTSSVNDFNCLNITFREIQSGD